MLSLQALTRGSCALSVISGLSKQSKLTWLSLAGNNLTTLDTGVLEKMPQLRYLSVENNAITYLRGLQVSCLVDRCVNTLF